MDDKDILGHIDELIKTEHDLRARLASGELTTDQEQEQLRAIEAELAASPAVAGAVLSLSAPDEPSISS